MLIDILIYSLETTGYRYLGLDRYFLKSYPLTSGYS